MPRLGLQKVANDENAIRKNFQTVWKFANIYKTKQKGYMYISADFVIIIKSLDFAKI